MNAPAQEKPLETSKVFGLRTYVEDLIGASININRIAVESGVSSSRLKLWLAGKDDPDIIPGLVRWKDEIEEASVLDSDFVLIPTSQGIIKSLDRARQPKGGTHRTKGKEVQRRGICLIYGASGTTKTTTIEWYQSQENGLRQMGTWPVVIVRCTGEEKRLSDVFAAILSAMEEAGFYRQHHENRFAAIIEHIPEGGIIIFDEAQLLPLRRMDELRTFPDCYGIAVAFVGNLTGYKYLFDAKIGQISSRVGGSCVVIEKPSEGDVDALLDAWKIGGKKVRQLALMIGMQDGGLRLLSATAKTARAFSNAKGIPIDETLFKSAAFREGAWGSMPAITGTHLEQSGGYA